MSQDAQFHPASQLGTPNPFQPPPDERPAKSATTLTKAGVPEVGIPEPGSRSAVRTATKISKVGSSAFDEEFKLIQVDDNDNQVDNTGGVWMRRVDCLGSDGLWHTLTIQEVEDCDVDGTKYYRLVLISERYSPH